ncbi:MAG: hypothetical protein ABFC24_09775 [Methanoregulaceae archaeon]
MKRIFLATILFLTLVSAVSAYGLNIAGPTSVQVGRPIIINLTSDLPTGTSIDVVFYQSQYTSTLVDTRNIVIQDNKANYTVIFSTTGLKGGQYKVEARLKTMTNTDLRTGSITSFITQIMDRSNEIYISSNKNQTLGNALVIEGTISGIGDSGVQLEVQGPSGTVFGPDWIETQKSGVSGDGKFSKTVAVTDAGEYDVSFSDQKGSSGSDIGTVVFNVIAPQTVPIPTQTTTVVKTTRIPTPTVTTQTSAPEAPPTQSPVSVWTVLVALAATGSAAVILRK